MLSEARRAHSLSKSTLDAGSFSSVRFQVVVTLLDGQQDVVAVVYPLDQNHSGECLVGRKVLLDYFTSFSGR